MRILRGLSSKFLPCGCVVGIYETYEGEVVGILDARTADCTLPTHQNGKQIPIAPDEPGAKSHRSGGRQPAAED